MIVIIADKNQNAVAPTPNCPCKLRAGAGHFSVVMNDKNA